MRIPSLLTAVATVLLIGNLWQWRVRTQAQQASTEQAASLRGKLAAVEAELTRTREHNEAFKAEAESLRKKLRANPSETQAEGARTASSSQANPNGAPPKNQPQDDEDPAAAYLRRVFEKVDPVAMRKVQAASLPKMYVDLPAEVGLSPEQADQAVELIMERNLSLAQVQAEKGSKDEKGKKLAAVSQRTRQELSQLLGEGGLAKFDQYERSLMDRTAAAEFGQTMSVLGEPISDDVRRQMVTVMTEERYRESTTSKALGNRQMSSPPTDEDIHYLINARNEADTRTRERLKGVLGENQFKRFVLFQRERADAEIMGLKMVRAFSGKP